MDKPKQKNFELNGTSVNLSNVKITDGVNLTAVTAQDSTQTDLNSHIEVFHALLKKVTNSPHELSLLKILQHLLDIDANNADNDLIWSNTTEIIQRTLQAHKREIVPRCLDVSVHNESRENRISNSPSLPPPPPPPVSSKSDPSGIVLLPQQKTPTPKAKMKSLIWDAIPFQNIVGNRNLWTILASNHNDDSGKRIDWSEVESLFYLKSSVNTIDTTLKRKQKLKLLNSQRTLNIAIFLEQFKGYKSDNHIIDLVYNGKHQVMGSEKINRLLKLLPDKEEIEMLTSFNGNRDSLDRPANFLLQLIKVPNYKLRIECMLLQEDFPQEFKFLKASLKLLIQAGNELIESKKLHEVLYVIVQVGNFLNFGKRSGKAVGIKVSSLLKLTETRANANNMNFMHFIAGQIKRSQPDLLNFPNDLKNLDKVTRINLEELLSDVTKLDDRLQKVKTEVELPETEEDIKQQMMKFIKKAESQMVNLKTGLNAVESMRLNLAKFFCEDSSKFLLKDCFDTFLTFVGNFQRAVNEYTQFESKTLQRQKRIEEKETENKRSRTLGSAKTGLGLTPDSPLSIKLFGETKPDHNDFIRIEISREIMAMGEVNNFLKPTKPEYNEKKGIAPIIQTTNNSSSKPEKSIVQPKYILPITDSHEVHKSVDEPSNMSVAERIKQISATANNTNEAQPTEHSRFLQMPGAETSSANNNENIKALPDEMRLTYSESPVIPKYERIGRRLSSITEQDLKEVIRHLRPVQFQKSNFN